MAWDTLDRYVVISSDGHAGADVGAYKPYLARRWHDEFDGWAATFRNPYGDRFTTAEPDRNWDSAARLAELEGQGIVAEVVFPNTVPPFYPLTSFFVPPAPQSRVDYERRWAGLQAHNRWLADFCSAAPGRHAGVAQLMLNDVDDALAEIRWVSEVGLMGGVLLPGVPPGSHLPQLYDPVYEPIWTLCEELRVPVNHHGGAGLPDFGFDGRSQCIFLIEVAFYGHRAVGHLIFAGVFERHPDLTFVMTELGTAWVPAHFQTLDYLYRRMHVERTAEQYFGGRAAGLLHHTPSEYFRRNCFIGASLFTSADAAARHAVGVDKIMWGDDYPHVEGTHPYSREAMRIAFADVPEEELRAMFAGNAARVYGFDLDQLAAVAGRVGPLVSEVASPLAVGDYPDGAANIFDRA